MTCKNSFNFYNKINLKYIYATFKVRRMEPGIDQRQLTNVHNGLKYNFMFKIM